MLDDDNVQSAAEIRCAESAGVRGIGRAGTEERILGSKCVFNWLSGQDVFLGATDNTDVAQFERVDLSLQNVDAISALVHQINFRKNSNRALAIRIHLASQLQGI